MQGEHLDMVGCEALQASFQACTKGGGRQWHAARRPSRVGHHCPQRRNRAHHALCERSQRLPETANSGRGNAVFGADMDARPA